MFNARFVTNNMPGSGTGMECAVNGFESNLLHMKKIIVILVALLALSGSLSAQNPPERVLFDPEYQGPVVEHDYYYLEPFGDHVGYSIYGSRYRKAKMNRGWGIFLTTVVAPASALLAAQGMAEDSTGAAVIGLAGVLGGFGCGIPLWVRGRHELDWMMDDYVRRYAPRPHSSLTVGPTRNGMGLALNF